MQEGRRRSEGRPRGGSRGEAEGSSNSRGRVRAVSRGDLAAAALLESASAARAAVAGAQVSIGGKCARGVRRKVLGALLAVNAAEALVLAGVVAYAAPWASSGSSVDKLALAKALGALKVGWAGLVGYCYANLHSLSQPSHTLDQDWLLVVVSGWLAQGVCCCLAFELDARLLLESLLLAFSICICMLPGFGTTASSSDVGLRVRVDDIDSGASTMLGRPTGPTGSTLIVCFGLLFAHSVSGLGLCTWSSVSSVPALRQELDVAYHGFPLPPLEWSISVLSLGLLAFAVYTAKVEEQARQERDQQGLDALVKEASSAAVEAALHHRKMRSPRSRPSVPKWSTSQDSRRTREELEKSVVMLRSMQKDLVNQNADENFRQLEMVINRLKNLEEPKSEVRPTLSSGSSTSIDVSVESQLIGDYASLQKHGFRRSGGRGTSGKAGRRGTVAAVTRSARDLLRAVSSTYSSDDNTVATGSNLSNATPSSRITDFSAFSQGGKYNAGRRPTSDLGPTLPSMIDGSKCELPNGAAKNAAFGGHREGAAGGLENDPLVTLLQGDLKNMKAGKSYATGASKRRLVGPHKKQSISSLEFGSTRIDDEVEFEGGKEEDVGVDQLPVDVIGLTGVGEDYSSTSEYSGDEMYLSDDDEAWQYDEEVFSKLKQDLPEKEVTYMRQQLQDWDFGPGGIFARLEDDQMPAAFRERPLTTTFIQAIQLFGCLESLSLDRDATIKYMLLIESKYEDKTAVPYHNSWHATDVLQSVSVLLSFDHVQSSIRSYSPKEMPDLSAFAILLGAAVHDVGHPGRNQAFQVRTESKMSVRYSDSVLEHHHLYLTFDAMRKRPILSNIDADLYGMFREKVIRMVLATDMAVHKENLGKLQELIGSGRPISKAKGCQEAVLRETREKGLSQLLIKERELDCNVILSSLLHCSDVSNVTKSWAVYKKWIPLLFTEFFDQGDRERELGFEVSEVHDSERCFPCEMQGYFIIHFVEELASWLDIWSRDIGGLLLKNLEENKQHLERNRKLKIGDMWAKEDCV